MATTKRPPRDPGLREIDDLERNIVLGRMPLLEWNAVPPDEIERERVKVTELAAAVGAQLRAEYLARRSRT